jgi:hypothetical protein
MRSLSTSIRRASSLALGSALILGGLPGMAQEAPAPAVAPLQQSIVIVADDGGLEAQSVRMLRTLTINELRRLGQSVSNDPVFEGVHPGGVETQALLKRTGGRTFALRIAGRLGSKLPLALDELKSDGSVLTSVSMTAASIEECDIVIPRMVESLISRKPVEDTARVSTVTAQEGRSYEVRSGTSRFVLGLVNPLFSGTDEDGGKNGMSIGYLYETPHFQMGVEGFFARSGNTNLYSQVFLHGAWLPLDGNFSPYLGAGIGNLWGDDRGADIDQGTAYRLTAGFEMFRLHHTRLMIGVDYYFLSSAGKETIYHSDYNPNTGQYQNWSEEVQSRTGFPMLHVKLAF